MYMLRTYVIIYIYARSNTPSRGVARYTQNNDQSLVTISDSTNQFYLSYFTNYIIFNHHTKNIKEHFIINVSSHAYLIGFKGVRCVFSWLLSVSYSYIMGQILSMDFDFGHGCSI